EPFCRGILRLDNYRNPAAYRLECARIERIARARSSESALRKSAEPRSPRSLVRSIREAPLWSSEHCPAETCHRSGRLVCGQNQSGGGLRQEARAPQGVGRG